MCRIRQAQGSPSASGQFGRGASVSNMKASTSSPPGGRGSRHFEECSGGYVFTACLPRHVTTDDIVSTSAPDAPEVSVNLVDTNKLLVLAQPGYKKLLALPADSIWSGIKASYINGLLRIAVPRASPRSINVPCQVLDTRRTVSESDVTIEMGKLHMDPLSPPLASTSSGRATAAQQQGSPSGSLGYQSEETMPYTVDFSLPAHPSVKIIEVQVSVCSVGVDVTWCYDQSHQIRRARFPHAFGDDLKMEDTHAFLDPTKGTLSLQIARKEQPRVRVRLDADSDLVSSRGTEAPESSRQSQEDIVLFSDHLAGLTADDVVLEVVGRELRISVLKQADSWEKSWLYANLNKTVLLPAKLKDIGSIRASCANDELKVVAPYCAMRRPKLRRLHVCTTAEAKLESNATSVSCRTECQSCDDVLFSYTTLEHSSHRSSSFHKTKRNQPRSSDVVLQRTRSLK